MRAVISQVAEVFVVLTIVMTWDDVVICPLMDVELNCRGGRNVSFHGSSFKNRESILYTMLST